MEISGSNMVGSEYTAAGETRFRAVDPSSGEKLDPAFHQATTGEVAEAVDRAKEAFEANRERSPEDTARLLEHIAERIEALGEQLVDRVRSETALAPGRIRGERQRTVDQLQMFADLVREGSWVDARIDGAVRRMLKPIGPVAVFGASNFPLAFSVAGGDTASALAAGCPVVVKAHPAHPGTSELVAGAIRSAVERSEFHEGTFSMVHGVDPEISIQLVEHPEIKAVGFTGSLKAGRAIYDAATSRPAPIPVYAEMGSVNPVFVLPSALRERSDDIAADLMESVTLGAGQFCTNPGLVFGVKGPHLDAFVEAAVARFNDTSPFTMLYAGICSAYENGVRRLKDAEGVRRVAGEEVNGSEAGTESGAFVFTTDEDTFLSDPHLQEEVFGPSTLIVQVDSERSFETIARRMEGNLTATIQGEAEDFSEHRKLIRVLEDKVGRLIFNGFPTGVKVCPAMHHGGPYPATTDVRSTSVGTAAIERFARPVCYQNFPQQALPPELRDDNVRGIWRLHDGRRVREDY